MDRTLSGRILGGSRYPHLRSTSKESSRRSGSKTPPDGYFSTPDGPDFPISKTLTYAESIAEFTTLGSKNVVVCILTLLTEVLNVAFMAQYGSVANVAAIGLANTMQNCFGLSVAFGMNQTFDTLASASAGAGMTDLGTLYLSRGQIAVGLYWVVVSPVMWYTNDILLFLGQDVEVSDNANAYNRASTLGLFFAFQTNALQRYLQNNGDTSGIQGVQAFTVLLHSGWCYLFIAYLKLGNAGLGFSNSITWVIQFILTSAYFLRSLRRTDASATWRDMLPSRAAFVGMRAYFALAIPGAALMAGEWWWWEILAVIAGLLGKVSLAAHVGVCSVGFIAYQIPSGLNVTTAFLVGREVGLRNFVQAKRFAVVAIACSFVIMCTLSATLRYSAPYIARIYSRDERVLALLAPTLCILSIDVVPDGLQNVMGAIIRVAERQRIAAFLYCIQSVVILSLALFFVVRLHLGVAGIWWGCVCGVTYGFFSFMLLAWCTIDFSVQVKRVQQRFRRDSATLSAPLIKDDRFD